MGNELQEVGTQGENSARLSDERQRDEAFGCEQPLALDPCLREESSGLRCVQSSVAIVPAGQETQPGPERSVWPRVRHLIGRPSATPLPGAGPESSARRAPPVWALEVRGSRSRDRGRAGDAIRE